MTSLADIKESLSVLKPDLMLKYPITTIGLFGSVVRNDFRADSDIDIIVDFNKSIGSDFILLAEELEEKLHRKVDLVSRGGIKGRYLKVIDPEIIYV